MTTATPSLRRLTPAGTCLRGPAPAAGAGIPAHVLTALVARLVSEHPARATAAAVVVFASCGGVPAHRAQGRCLRHCRSPLSLPLHYGAYRGWLRDVRAGAHHGAYCLGCCWSLMVLFVVIGVMSLAAMVVLAVVVLVEKLWVHGDVLARAVGVAALVLAVAATWLPALAPGLHATNQMRTMAGS